MTRCGSLLVVDDNELNRDALSRRLANKGYAVAVAASGPEALAMIDERPFDLVLLDVEMPGVSGIEVLRQGRASRTQPHLPIITVTARSDGADIVQAVLLGADLC